MTTRPTDPQRLPTLTDVIEYDGEVMTLRSIAPTNARDEAPTPVAPADAGIDHPPVLSAGSTVAAPVHDIESPTTLDLLLHQFGETFERQLRAALTPLLEQIVHQAVDAARCSLADAFSETDTRVAGVTASVSTPQRASAAPDAGDVSF